MEVKRVEARMTIMVETAVEKRKETTVHVYIYIYTAGHVNANTFCAKR